MDTTKRGTRRKDTRLVGRVTGDGLRFFLLVRPTGSSGSAIGQNIPRHEQEKLSSCRHRPRTWRPILRQHCQRAELSAFFWLSVAGGSYNTPNFALVCGRVVAAFRGFIRPD